VIDARRISTATYMGIVKSAFHHIIFFSVEVKTKKLDHFYYSTEDMVGRDMARWVG
jgi:hypothetical protein